MTNRKLPIVLACLAILLTIRALENGLQFDDNGHRDILLGRADWVIEDASLTGMFSFLDGVPERTKQMMDSGSLPWWTFEQIRITFFRPLAEISHWLDYRLWPDSPLLMHAHSLFWFGLVIFMATCLYQKIMGPIWAAGVAAFLYAVDDAHGMVAGWLANRNALIAAVFGMATLIVHHHWRRGEWKRRMIAGPFCLLLGLLSSEAAIATGAYLLAYEIFLVRGSFWKKIGGLIPYMLVVIPWWILYHQSGFGAWGSGAYLDPGQEPLLYLNALIERIPILLLGQWFFPSSGIYGYLPKNLANFIWLGAVVFLVLLAILLIPLLKRDSVARFWTLGMFLSLLPICTTFPANRLLLFVGLGAMGLLACLLTSWFEKSDWLSATRNRRLFTRIFVTIFIVIHVIAAPLTLPMTATGFAKMVRVLAEQPLLDLPDEDNMTEKTLVFINPPIPFFLTHTLSIRRTYDRTVPACIRILAPGFPGPTTITRVDEHSLELQPEEGFTAMDLDKLFRGSNHPMQVGQQVKLTDMTVEVLSRTKDQRPLRVRFTFALPLGNPLLLFLESRDRHFVQFTLPEIGESIRLPGSAGLF